jgi:menaquinone-dependent protoporphyrinogen IX oxidase
MIKMRILVVYYSRTGLTKKIATQISTLLKADIDEIVDKKDRSGPLGYMVAGKDAMKGFLTQISYGKDSKDYDMIIIGGPVWAWTVTPAVRTYLDKNADVLRIKKVAFFATQGSSGAEKKFEEMEQILRMKPLSTLIINGKDFREHSFEFKIDKFVSVLK